MKQIYKRGGHCYDTTRIQSLVLLVSISCLLILSSQYTSNFSQTNIILPPNQADITFSIHIDGNNASLLWSECEWVNGSGTFADPYIIQDLMINASNAEYGIWVENSAAYFLIENCSVLEAMTAGIFLNNCSNGELRTNNCTMGLTDGISLYSSSNITISENNCNQNYGHGIDLSFSENSTIIGNNASWNTAPTSTAIPPAIPSTPSAA